MRLTVIRSVALQQNSSVCVWISHLIIVLPRFELGEFSLSSIMTPRVAGFLSLYQKDTFANSEKLYLKDRNAL